MPPKYLPQNVTILDEIQRHRMQTLLSVDEMVENVLCRLKKLGILHNTYVLFLSDNGFHIGKEFSFYFAYSEKKLWVLVIYKCFTNF